MMQFDVLITNTNIATMSDALKTPYRAIHDGTLGIKDGKIAFVGTTDDSVWQMLTKSLMQNKTS